MYQKSEQGHKPEQTNFAEWLFALAFTLFFIVVVIILILKYVN